MHDEHTYACQKEVDLETNTKIFTKILITYNAIWTIYSNVVKEMLFPDNFYGMTFISHFTDIKHIYNVLLHKT